MEVLGGDQVRERDRLVLVADQDQGAEAFEAVAGQVAAAEAARAAATRASATRSIRSGSQVIRMLAPGECSAWLIRSAAT